MPGNEDWFSVEVCEGGTLDVGIGFVHEDGDLDLVVFDAAGDEVGASLGAGDGELVVGRDLPAGTYVARVFGVGEVHADYVLDVGVACPAQAADDAFEENDDPQQARPVEPGDHPGLVLPPGDGDWFLVQTCPAGTLTVGISFEHDAGDLDLALTSYGRMAPSASESDDEEVVLDELYEERVFVHVFGRDGAENTYDLHVALDCEPAWDDDFEDNDVLADAAPLPEDPYVHLRVLPRDDDWYAVDVDCEPATVAAILESGPEGGDLDLELCDGLGQVVHASRGAGDREAITARDLPVGRWYLRVHGVGGAWNDYGLRVSVSCLEAGDDPFEDNDDLAQAMLLEPGLHRGLVLRDADVYALDVCEGATLTVGLAFVHADGDLDLAVLDREGQEVGAALSVNDDEELVLEGLPAGRSFVGVVAPPGTDTTYDLSVVGRCVRRQRHTRDGDVDRAGHGLRPRARPLRPGLVPGSGGLRRGDAGRGGPVPTRGV